LDKTFKNQDVDAIARGERAKLLRTTLRLSRADCTRKFNIPIGSLQTWEEAWQGGLTPKGAKRLIEAYAQEGLICSLEWLYDGIGPSPTFSHKEVVVVPDEGEKPKTKRPNEDIQQELILFHKHNENAVDTIISDDALAPHFQKGDLVAGVRFFDKDLKKAIGSLCIVETVSGDKLIGYLEIESISHNYSLFNCKNAEKKPIEKHLKLFWAAPIIWTRRNLSL
jgi:hypothetical protein